MLIGDYIHAHNHGIEIKYYEEVDETSNKIMTREALCEERVRVFSLPRRHFEWGVQGKYLVSKASALFVNMSKPSSRFDGVGGFQFMQQFVG